MQIKNLYEASLRLKETLNRFGIDKLGTKEDILIIKFAKDLSKYADNIKDTSIINKFINGITIGNPSILK